MLKQERLAGKISSYYMYSTVVYVLAWMHVYLSLWMSYNSVTQTDEFNKRRLLAKSFAGIEEHCMYTKSLLVDCQRRISTVRRRCIVTKWYHITMKAKKSRSVKEKKATKNGHRLLLLRAVQSWRSGVTICQKEREVDMLVAEKLKEVEKWLE